ncbi:MAG: ABC transporter permease [Spirochaetia bacterium]
MAPVIMTGDNNTTKPFLQKVWGSLSNFREGTLILIIILIGVVTTLLSPYFLTPDNLSTVILSFAINGIGVIGMTVVMVSGGLDLSIGSVIGMIGAIAGKLYLIGVNVWIAAVIALAVGALIGAINGFFITRVGLSPFITTLAMYSIARGAAYVVAQGIPLSLYSMPQAFKSIGTGDIWGIPFVVIILIVFVVLADFMMRRATIMRKVFYAGSNEKAALFAGVNVRRVKMGVYILCSFLAGLVGVLSVARFATATPYFAVALTHHELLDSPECISILARPCKRSDTSRRSITRLSHEPEVEVGSGSFPKDGAQGWYLEKSQQIPRIDRR